MFGSAFMVVFPKGSLPVVAVYSPCAKVSVVVAKSERVIIDFVIFIDCCVLNIYKCKINAKIVLKKLYLEYL